MNNARFKFRVWLPDENRYLHNTDCPVVDSDGNLMWCYLNSFGHWEHHKMENAVIEQCTGLTDKNGKLIYEGDIVRETFEDGGSIDKLVFYNELQCKWYTRYNFRVSPGDAAFWEFGHHISHKLGIIGNIHDNQFREVTKMMEDKDNGTNESKP